MTTWIWVNSGTGESNPPSWDGRVVRSGAGESSVLGRAGRTLRHRDRSWNEWVPNHSPSYNQEKCEVTNRCRLKRQKEKWFKIKVWSNEPLEAETTERKVTDIVPWQLDNTTIISKLLKESNKENVQNRKRKSKKIVLYNRKGWIQPP
jgi:hypothetical protein